jgi:5-methylcytosine-specific restriction protein A
MTKLPRAAARRHKKADPFYLTKAWEKKRLEVLRRDKYLCQKCGVKCIGKKRGGASPHIDHIIPRSKNKGLELALSNLRTLCHSCHSKITVADNHGRDMPEIGIDGYPVTTG